jgi:hypothetical protein
MTSSRSVAPNLLSLTVIIVLMTLCHDATALSFSRKKHIQHPTTNAATQMPASSASLPVEISRRDAAMQAFKFGVGSAAAGAFLLVTNPSPVVAAGAANAPPTKEELDRIRTGYKQIQYLLDNFEQQTTTCRENGGECKRDAEPIRKALGLRSTTDPLFQIEKGTLLFFCCGGAGGGCCFIERGDCFVF